MDARKSRLLMMKKRNIATASTCLTKIDNLLAQVEALASREEKALSRVNMTIDINESIDGIEGQANEQKHRSVVAVCRKSEIESKTLRNAVTDIRRAYFNKKSVLDNARFDLEDS